MNNKLIIIFIIFFQIFFINKLYSKDVQFNATEMEVLEEGELTIAYNGSAIIKDDNISIEGSTIRYFKNKSLLIVNNGNIKRINDNFVISSEIIEYDIERSNLNFKNNVKIANKTFSF